MGKARALKHQGDFSCAGKDGNGVSVGMLPRAEKQRALEHRQREQREAPPSYGPSCMDDNLYVPMLVLVFSFPEERVRSC